MDRLNGSSTKLSRIVATSLVLLAGFPSVAGAGLSGYWIIDHPAAHTDYAIGSPVAANGWAESNYQHVLLEISLNSSGLIVGSATTTADINAEWSETIFTSSNHAGGSAEINLLKNGTDMDGVFIDFI